MVDRNKLIEMVTNARDSIDRGEPNEVLFHELEELLPDSDVRNLCHSDYAPETIVDISLRVRETKRILTKEEMADVVRKLLAIPDSEAEDVLLRELFENNCRHAARGNLIYHPRRYFGGRSNPSIEEIVELAWGDGSVK
jgi:hypothetical protein